MNFITLVKLEWLKIQNWQTFMFLVIYILIAILFIFGVFLQSGLPPADGKYIIDLASLNPFGKLIAQYISLLAIISSLFYILQTGGEYKHGMIRKSVMDGMGRDDIFTGKMIFMVMSYLGWTIVLLLVFITFGLVRLPGHFSEFLSSIQLTQLVKFIIYLFFYGSLSHFLVTLTKSSTIAIFILIGASVLEGISLVALTYYKMTDVIPYLPFQLASYIRVQDVVPTEKIAVFLGYILLFLGSSHWITAKRDL